MSQAWPTCGSWNDHIYRSISFHLISQRVEWAIERNDSNQTKFANPIKMSNLSHWFPVQEARWRSTKSLITEGRSHRARIATITALQCSMRVTGDTAFSCGSPFSKQPFSSTVHNADVFHSKSGARTFKNTNQSLNVKDLCQKHLKQFNHLRIVWRLKERFQNYPIQWSLIQKDWNGQKRKKGCFDRLLTCEISKNDHLLPILDKFEMKSNRQHCTDKENEDSQQYSQSHRVFRDVEDFEVCWSWTGCGIDAEKKQTEAFQRERCIIVLSSISIWMTIDQSQPLQSQNHSMRRSILWQSALSQQVDIIVAS
jgi:hypothetical protein